SGGSDKSVEVPRRAARTRAMAVDDAATEIKIVAMFSITIASLLGAVPPVVLRSPQPILGRFADTSAQYLLRAFTSGVLIALAFMHVIADGFEKMQGLNGNLNVASLLVVSGIMLMYVVERVSLDILVPAGVSGACCHSHAHQDHRSSSRPRKGQQVSDYEEELLNDICCTDSGCSSKPGAVPQVSPQEIEVAGDDHNAADGSTVDGSCCMSDSEHVHGHEHSHGHGHSHGHANAHGHHGHTHLHESRSGEEMLTETGPGHQSEHVMLGMLELGIIVHSIALGLDFGASQSESATAISYLVALCFHQLFEGIGLGTMIAGVMQQSRGQIRTIRLVLMIGFFAVTLPAGILIGMVLQNVPIFRQDSPQQRWLIGVLDCVSGGILVYICLGGCGALTADFASLPPGELRVRWLMIGAMFLGILVMAVLSIWA
ncbi:MAG: ZIP family transporter, partial [Promethearchaeia archaeon]